MSTASSPATPHSGNLNPEGFISQQVSRIRRNLCIANGIALAILLFFAWLTSGYYYCFFRGPRLVTPDQMLEIAKSPGSGNLLDYVEMHDQVLVSTGLYEESTNDDKVYSINPYYLVAIGEKFLLVKTEDKAPSGKVLRGPVAAVYSKPDQSAHAMLLSARPDLRSRLLPIILNDAAAFNVAGYIGLVFFTPLFLLCTYNLVKAVHGLGGWALHPVTRALVSHGDPFQLASQIDAEVASDTTIIVGKVTLTEQWLLHRSVFALQVISLPTIVWCYHLVLNGSHIAVLHLRSGKSISIPMKEAFVASLLREVQTRIPWVQTGYSSEMHRQWQKDRGPLTAQVDLRMQAYLAKR